MAQSPYQAPSSQDDRAPQGPRLGQLWLLYGVGLVFSLPSAGVLAYLAFVRIRAHLYAWWLPPVPWPFVISSTLVLLSGLLLLARNRLAVPFFFLCVCLNAYSIAAHPQVGLSEMALALPNLLAFIFACWVRRRGLLGSGPNNSSKPTPLRGAA